MNKKLVLSFLAASCMTASMALAQTAPGDAPAVVPQVITLTEKDGVAVTDGLQKYIQVGLDQELEITIDLENKGSTNQDSDKATLFNQNEFLPSNIESILTLTGNNLVKHVSPLKHDFLGYAYHDKISYTQTLHFKPDALGSAVVYMLIKRGSWYDGFHARFLDFNESTICFPIKVVPAATAANPFQQ